jgi:hypothetical protein
MLQLTFLGTKETISTLTQKIFENRIHHLVQCILTRHLIIIISRVLNVVFDFRLGTAGPKCHVGSIFEDQSYHLTRRTTWQFRMEIRLTAVKSNSEISDKCDFIRTTIGWIVDGCCLRILQ